MQLLQFEHVTFGTNVYVNPETITFISEQGEGVTLHFIGGESVTVRCENESQLIERLLLEYPGHLV